MLAKWVLIEADLHETYGVDVASGVLDERDGRWLRTRILGLLMHADTRLARSFQPEPEEKVI